MIADRISIDQIHCLELQLTSLLVANARIEGLEKSLHMPSNGFNTAIWIFYIPFVLIEIPSNMIMTMPRVRPNIFLGCNMFILGIIAMCQGLTASYKGLLAIRFLMGIFEAALPAGEHDTLNSLGRGN